MGRQMIGENKGLLVGSYLAYFGISVGLSLISMFFGNSQALTFIWSIAILFITYPLMLGLLHINNMVYYKRQCRVGNLFDFFSNYRVSLKVIGVNLILTVIMMAVMIPIMIIMLGSIFASVSIGLLGGVQSNINLSSMLGSFLLCMLLVMVLAMLISSFMMASYFIALRNRSITFGKLLGSSFKIGGKYVWRYFTFQLSFIGWMLLCIVPFLVVTVFVAIAGPGLGSIALLMLMLIVFIAGIFAVSLYINAASVAFFNTAIDEYEQLHPDYSGFVPPHIPQTPGFPQEGGEQNYGQPGDGSYGQEGQDEQGPEIH
ncbi:MAG: hypothetical protein DBX66_06405 [Clostridiales bacterium]|nr:MAG: hypothetical protein DBX66_06405 [Clostridiales bacterium]